MYLKGLTLSPTGTLITAPAAPTGIIHRLVAEVIDELEIEGQTIGVAPVGCAVMAYDYFACDMVEAAHGRAPAVATGIKRANPDNVVFTYQGDGDLASIGTAEILHAAARGENITVIFVNNAIYGMTGGQMAPTSLPGQITETSPYGRSPAVCGYPLRICEMLATLDGSEYLARVSVHSVRAVRRAKKAVRRAFENQLTGRGFSLVEFLLLLPHQLGDDASGGSDLGGKHHDSLLSPGCIQGQERKGGGRRMTERILIAGFGGQGVLFAGKFLTVMGMLQGKQVSWLPSYGPEMRGGTANCSVVIGDEPVSSPIVYEPDILLAMNLPSLDKYENAVAENGWIFVNSSLVDRQIRRTNVRDVYVPATRLATENEMEGLANMILAGAMLAGWAACDEPLIQETLKHLVSDKHPELFDRNLQALRLGSRFRGFPPQAG